MQKLPSLSLGFFALGTTLLIGFKTPVFAQAAASPKPIAKQQLDELLAIGALNICSLLEDKVPYRVAMKSNIISIGSFISYVHGSQIEGANGGKALSQDSLSQGLAVQLSYGVVSRCEKQIPERDLSEIKKAFAELEKASKEESLKK